MRLGEQPGQQVVGQRIMSKAADVATNSKQRVELSMETLIRRERARDRLRVSAGNAASP